MKQAKPSNPKNNGSHNSKLTTYIYIYIYIWIAIFCLAHRVDVSKYFGAMWVFRPGLLFTKGWVAVALGKRPRLKSRPRATAELSAEKQPEPRALYQQRAPFAGLFLWRPWKITKWEGGGSPDFAKPCLNTTPLMQPGGST